MEYLDQQWKWLQINVNNIKQTLQLCKFSSGGGSYDELDGKKIGKWIEINENCTDVINSGKYQQAIQIGKWDFCVNQSGKYQQIGGGSYDEGGKGIKIGKWIEIDEKSFSVSKQRTHIGEYINGKKYGVWKTFYDQIYLEACYLYDQMGRINNKNIIKKGITLIGETKLGKKVGKWEILSVKNQYFGGGLYSNGIKMGLWIKTDYRSQITQIGEYKNGKKVGRWDMWENYFNDNQPNINIGGGSYDQEGLGIKIGKWTYQVTLWRYDKRTYIGEYQNGNKVGVWKEFSESNRFMYSKASTLRSCVLYDLNGIQIYESQLNNGVLEIGQVQNGKKFGRWEILGKNNEQIGGGSYHEGGDGTKTGKWVEIKKNGLLVDTQEKITQFILVNIKMGKKQVDGRVGQKKMSMSQCKKLIKRDIVKNGSGGGHYDLEGNGNKIGKWIDLDDQFLKGKYVTYRGLYKNGEKVGRWDILISDIHKDTDVQFGGGHYDDGGNGNKIGRWIDLDDQFLKGQNLSHRGLYKNGKKVGRWDIWFSDLQKGTDVQIGGGSYDEEGREFKIGMWRQIDRFYSESFYTTENCEYDHGKQLTSRISFNQNSSINTYKNNKMNYI
ncbi:unnamed protein product [Paramecium octaurelia]|uniref:Uncharacterized protein n=1 Tax=Paramecium octaurelia TaxID=43137 RepID=A0A8S1WHA1_PAROT|nr:unnamed protein product [Paramecium octaurelia]